MRKISVKLNSQTTQIHVGSGLNDLIVRVLSNTQERNLFIVSKSIYPNVREVIKTTSLKDPIIIDLKEKNKGLKSFEDLVKQCYDRSLDRRGKVIAIGGGMMGDYVGFLAASYMRGVEFVYIPTTLMAQCDAIINKVALNVNGVKNLIGTFYSPTLIFCDVNFIASLPESAISYGMSEIVKYALIEPSKLLKSLKDYSQNNIQREKYNWEEIVYESLKIKLGLIKKDFFDTKGIQIGLNYGHTFAHALEDYSEYSYPHGYAVALGLKLAGSVSNELELLSNKDMELQNQLLQLTRLNLSLPSNFNTNKYISLLKRHRRSTNKINLILLNKPGGFAMYNRIDEDLIRKIIDRHKSSEYL